MSSLKRGVGRLVAIALTVAFMFTGTPVTFAASSTTATQSAVLKTSDITIPDYMGSIVRSYNGTNGKLIIHVQDLHSNFDAQVAHKDILALLANKGVKLIANEGKSSERDFGYMRNYATPEVMTSLCEDSIRDGVLNGVDYYDLTAEKDVIRPGVEDKELYSKNVKSYFQMKPLRGKAARVLRKLSALADSEKAKIYSDALKQFDSKRADYKKTKITTAEYFDYLKSLVKDIDARFPNTASVIKLVELEKNIDFVKVNSERENVTAELNKVLADSDKGKLEELNSLYREGSVKAAEYYKKLDELATLSGVSAERKNLLAYKDYVALYEGINFSDLSKEQDVVELEAGMSLCKTADQKALFEISEKINTATNVVDLKVTKDEYKRFLNDHNAKGWISFLKADVSAKEIEDLDAVFSVVKDFYSIAGKRDEAFIKNLANSMAKNNQNTAVLVTGGFHTEGVTDLLKKEGYSFVVISPRINDLSGTEDVYNKAMAQTMVSLEGMLATQDILDSNTAEGQFATAALARVGAELEVVSTLNGKNAQLSVSNGKCVIKIAADKMGDTSTPEGKAKAIKQAISELVHEAKHIELINNQLAAIITDANDSTKLGQENKEAYITRRINAEIKPTDSTGMNGEENLAEAAGKAALEKANQGKLNEIVVAEVAAFTENLQRLNGLIRYDANGAQEPLTEPECQALSVAVTTVKTLVNPLALASSDVLQSGAQVVVDLAYDAQTFATVQASFPQAMQSKIVQKKVTDTSIAQGSILMAPTFAGITTVQGVKIEAVAGIEAPLMSLALLQALKQYSTLDRSKVIQVMELCNSAAAGNQELKTALETYTNTKGAA